MATITQRVVRRAKRHYDLDVLWHAQYGSRARGVYAWRRKNRPVARLKADTVVQHITVTRPSGDFRADVRTVERIGQERFGSGISYNFLVNMADGQIAVGQPLDAKGTHTLNDKDRDGFSFNQNLVARAIAVVGMPGTPLSKEAEESIARLLAAMMDEDAITTHIDYEPHSFFAWKDCPCDATRDRMPEIWKRANELRKARKKPGRHKRDKREEVSLRRVRNASRRARWARGWSKKTRQDVGIVEGALEDEGFAKYHGWQRAQGVEDGHGVPDLKTLRALGRRHGFRVVK